MIKTVFCLLLIMCYLPQSIFASDQEVQAWKAVFSNATKSYEIIYLENEIILSKTISEGTINTPNIQYKLSLNKIPEATKVYKAIDFSSLKEDFSNGGAWSCLKFGAVASHYSLNLEQSLSLDELLIHLQKHIEKNQLKPLKVPQSNFPKLEVNWEK